jgi:hypothetical protein
MVTVAECESSQRTSISSSAVAAFAAIVACHDGAPSVSYAKPMYPRGMPRPSAIRVSRSYAMT